MRKTSKICLFVFMFVALFSVCGSLFLPNLSASAETVNTSGYSTADAFASYVNNWASGNATDSISISANLDMSQQTVKGSIGNVSTAFKGTFDGQGYTISNLTITLDLSSGGSTGSQYAGLFGYLSGATIQNVTFSNLKIVVIGGSLTLSQCVGLVGYAENSTISGVTISGLTIDVSSVSTCTDQSLGVIGSATSSTISEISLAGKVEFEFNNSSISYVGGIVGKATESTIYNNQNISTSTFSASSSFSGVSYVALLVGYADNSEIYQAILRRTIEISQFSSTTSGSTYVGGAIGGMTNGASVYFVSIEADFTLSAATTFVGTVYVGGAVALVSGGYTMAQDLAIENTYSVTDTTSQIQVGEVVGIFTSPTTTSGNVSYIHYASQGYGRFANSGNYAFLSSTTYDNVTATSNKLGYLSSTTDSDGSVSYVYFTSENWATFLGDWDFDTVWYVTEGILSLQCFYDNYQISTRSTNVIVASVESSSVKYGESVVLKFLFSEGLEDYYTANYLVLGSTNVATIKTTGSGSSATYSISSPELYSIEKKSESGQYGFQITIASVNMSTTGEYYVSSTANSYSMTVYAAIDLNDLSSETDVSNITISSLKWEVPSSTIGYVYYSTSSYTTRPQISTTVSYESTSQTIETKVVSGQPYVFSGFWLLVDTSGNVLDLVKASTFEFSFEDYDISCDFEVLPLYSTDACVISFDISDGIAEILVGEQVVDDTAMITVAKSTQNLKLTIKVSSGYELNVEDFEDYTDIFKGSIQSGGDPTTDDDGYTTYVYTLDMSSLKDNTLANNLNLKVHTSVIKKSVPTWVWIVVGSVIGGLVLIGLIVLLIIFIVKKKQNGGFGGSSFGKRRRGGVYY